MKLPKVCGQSPFGLGILLFVMVGIQLFDFTPFPLLWLAQQARKDLSASAETTSLTLHAQGGLAEVKSLAAEVKAEGLPPLRSYAPDGEVECLHLSLPKTAGAVLEIKVAGIDARGCVISSSAHSLRMPLRDAINLHLELLPLERPLCSRTARVQEQR